MRDSDHLRRARDYFAALLENPESPERDWQRLFTKFPFILTDCLALGITPDQLVPCRPGRAEADFYFYPETSNPLSPYGVIEVKRPSTRILRAPRKDVMCLSAEVTTAVAQAKKYASELKAETEKVPSQPLILGNNLHMFVIAGLSAELAERVATEIHFSQVAALLPPQCQLVPFDVLSRVLAAKVPPRMHVIVPAYDPGPRRTWVLGDWACSSCGTPIPRLPFEPSPGHPIFCQECWSSLRTKGLRGEVLSSVPLTAQGEGVSLRAKGAEAGDARAIAND